MKAPFGVGDVVEKFKECPMGDGSRPIGFKTVVIGFGDFSFHGKWTAVKLLSNAPRRHGCSCCIRLYEPPKPEVKVTEKQKEKTE